MTVLAIWMAGDPIHFATAAPAGVARALERKKHKSVKRGCRIAKDETVPPQKNGYARRPQLTTLTEPLITAVKLRLLNRIQFYELFLFLFFAMVINQPPESLNESVFSLLTNYR